MGRRSVHCPTSIVEEYWAWRAGLEIEATLLSLARGQGGELVWLSQVSRVQMATSAEHQRELDAAQGVSNYTLPTPLDKNDTSQCFAHKDSKDRAVDQVKEQERVLRE